MANYILDNNAEDINTAIGKALNPDTTLTGTVNDDPSLITAGAAKTYIDGQVGQVSDFVGKTVTTEGTGIFNTDNDTSVPTSAAVVDYVANYGKATMGDLTSVSAGTYTAATDLYITLTSVIQKAGHTGNAVKNLAKITIEGNIFTAYVSPTTGNSTTEYGSASFFVKKGESYTIDLGSSSGALATAFSRTFNFTP